MAKRKYSGRKRKGSGKRPDSALYKWMMRRKGTGKKKLVAAVTGKKNRTYNKKSGKGVSFKPGTSTREKRMVRAAQSQEDRDEYRAMNAARSQERTNRGKYLYTGRDGTRVYGNDRYVASNDPNAP